MRFNATSWTACTYGLQGAVNTVEPRSGWPKGVFVVSYSLLAEGSTLCTPLLRELLDSRIHYLSTSRENHRILDNTHGRFGGLSGRADGLSSRIGSLRSQIDGLRSRIGIPTVAFE